MADEIPQDEAIQLSRKDYLSILNAVHTLVDHVRNLHAANRILVDHVIGMGVALLDLDPEKYRDLVLSQVAGERAADSPGPALDVIEAAVINALGRPRPRLRAVGSKSDVNPV